MESKGFNPEHTPGADGRRNESGVEVNRQAGERSRLAGLANSKLGRLGMTALLFTTLAAEVACSRESGDAGKGGEKRMEEQSPGAGAAQELMKQLANIPDNPNAGSPAQNRLLKRNVARGKIGAFLKIRGDTPETRAMIDRALGNSQELAWLREGKVVSEVAQSSQRIEKGSQSTAEKRAVDLLKSFQGLTAPPSGYRQDVETYFRSFSPGEKQEALDALKAAMENSDLVNNISKDARTALQRALHEHTTTK